MAAHLPAVAWSQSPANDAYLDEAAAAMVTGARTSSDSANARIDAYEMVAKQRVSLGLQAGRRDRLLYRREVASRVSWTRDGGRRSEIIGAREAVPIAMPGVQPLGDGDFRSGAADLAIDPTGGWLLRVPTVGGGDDEDEDGDDEEDEEDDDDEDVDGTILHPLAEGSEEHYRFRSGETTTIRLADGRTIRLVELQVLPRRARPNLLSGSFWLDAATNAPVRGVFSLAAPARMELNAGMGIVSLPVATGSAMLRYVTVEYGLWDGEWWLPRLIAMEGEASVGVGAIGSLTVPIVLEQAYEDYRIYSSASPWPGFADPDTTLFRVVERRCGDEVEDCPSRTILIPRDSSVLVHSPELPRSIYSRAAWLVGERELTEVAELLSASRWRGMMNRIPRVEWNPVDGRLIHYNRVEGLTLGTSAGVELEPLAASASLWVGIADLSPSLEIELSRSRIRGRETISAYRRLEAFSPMDNPFSLGSSVSALFFGRDDGDYYRALGVGLTSEHTLTPAVSVELSTSAERHTSVEKETDASLPNWTGDRTFRDNPPVDEADQVGAEIRALFNHGLDPSAFRFGFEATLRGETGTYQFVRPSAAVFTTFPLPGPLLGALELSGGTAFGELPVQRLWYVGGRGSVRGINALERVVGDAFWSARAEMGTDVPGARLVVFGDAGWAGPRSELEVDPALISAGAGVSFLDGLIRIDLARPIRGGSGWSLQAHIDAPL
jgi:hypothetical protein